MSKEVYWKAVSLLKNGKVSLESSGAGHFTFRVNGHEVFRNAKGDWSCNAAKLVEKKVTKRKAYLIGFETALKTSKYIKVGCVLFGQGKICSHIRAAQMWLEGKDLNETED